MSGRPSGTAHWLRAVFLNGVTQGITWTDVSPLESPMPCLFFLARAIDIAAEIPRAGFLARVIFRRIQIEVSK